MKWKFWKREIPTTATRSFKAAQFNNTTDIGSSLNINSDLQSGLKTIRYRARELVQNNGYAAGIITNLKNNVIGPSGIKLTVQGKRRNGQLDTAGNEAIEEAWECFTKYGNCDVEENKDFTKVCEMALQACAVDGESVILIHRGDEFGKHKIRLELLSADVIADYYTLLQNGNIVFQGVECNDYGKTVALWLYNHDITDPSQIMYSNGGNTYYRVPIEDVIHLYDQQQTKQKRGVSWLASSLLNLHHVSQLQATELQMARLAALKRVMFTVSPDENYVADPKQMDEFYNVNSKLDAASIEVLQPGMDVKTIDWNTPNTGLAEFTKTILRQVAAGCSVSYNAIAKDLESVSYSSSRTGAMEDRISYAQKQRFFSYAFVDRVYQEWLKVQLMYNSIQLPNGKSFGIDYYDQFSKVKFTARGWTSIDPLKDANANKINLGLMATSYSEICAQTGRDFNEVLTERVKEEKQIRDAYIAAGLEAPPIETLIYGVQPEVEPPEEDGDEGQQPINKNNAIIEE